MRTLQRRQPFYGEAVDRELLGPDFKPAMEELAELPDDLAALQTLEPSRDSIQVVGAVAGGENDSQKQRVHAHTSMHPDCREIGVEIPLGFIPHRGENRRQRLTGVKTWEPDPNYKPAEGEAPMPTRRGMFEQRKRKERGKLDPVLRRLQRERLKR